MQYNKFWKELSERLCAYQFVAIFYFVEILSINNETWIHLNLKAIEISEQTQKINRYSKVWLSKVNNNAVEQWFPFGWV